MSADPLGFGLTAWKLQWLAGPAADQQRRALCRAAPAALDVPRHGGLPFRLYGRTSLCAASPDFGPLCVASPSPSPATLLGLKEMSVYGALLGATLPFMNPQPGGGERSGRRSAMCDARDITPPPAHSPLPP